MKEAIFSCGFDSLYIADDRESHPIPTLSVLPKSTDPKSSPHDVDGENAALMTGKQVIDEVADDRVWLVAELCHNPANERATARMPFQVNRPVNIPGAVYFGPAMRASGLFRPDFNEAKFLFQERISHDLVA